MPSFVRLGSRRIAANIKSPEVVLNLFVSASSSR